MKKLIVFSVIFALLSAAVFAEINVGASYGGTLSFGGTSVEDTKPWAGGGHDLRIDIGGQNDEATFGAQLRTWANGDGGRNFGWVWWKPLDFLRIQVGHNEWSDFGSNEIVVWDFYKDAGDNAVAEETYSWASFYGGFGSPGALLGITPIQGLSINFAVPFLEDGRTVNAWSGWWDADPTESKGGLNNNGEYEKPDGYMVDRFSWFMGQVQYWIEGIGKIGITYTNANPRSIKGTWGDGSGTFGEDFGIWFGAAPALYANFFLTALESSGLHVNVGLRFQFSASDEIAGWKVSKNRPVLAGFGVNFWSGDLGLMARLQAGFGGSEKTEVASANFNITINDPFELSFDILPSYDLGIFKFFFSAGIKLTGKKQIAFGDEVKDVEKSDTFSFHINPYIVKPVSSGGTFYAGFKLESGNLVLQDGDKAVLRWRIPLAFAIGL